MSLNKADIEDIRIVFKEEIQAVEDDVKEIYFMLSGVQHDIRGLKTDVNHLKINVSFIADHFKLALPKPSQ